MEELFIFSCENYDDMMVMLWEGMRRRAVGSHTLNADSSRSHSMLTLYVESEVLDEEGQPTSRCDNTPPHAQPTTRGDWGHRDLTQSIFAARTAIHLHGARLLLRSEIAEPSPVAGSARSRSSTLRVRSV